MADCSYWEYQISLALDGAPGTGGKDGLNRHLAECAHCRDVKDAFGKSAQALQALPDLAGPDLLAGLKQDILAKTYRTRPARLAWPAVAAGLLAVFAAANIWLGPLWQRPALLAAAVAPGNRLELTFNQSMDSGSWPGTTTLQENTHGPLKAGSPAPGGPQAGAARTFAAFATPEPAPPYTVNRQGDRLVVSFAGPLPQGPVQILVPATVRDLWGRELGRAYLVVIDHGKITVKTL